jgi:hypothetical protein
VHEDVSFSTFALRDVATQDTILKIVDSDVDVVGTDFSDNSIFPEFASSETIINFANGRLDDYDNDKHTFFVTSTPNLGDESTTIKSYLYDGTKVFADDGFEVKEVVVTKARRDTTFTAPDSAIIPWRSAINNGGFLMNLDGGFIYLAMGVERAVQIVFKFNSYVDRTFDTVSAIIGGRYRNGIISRPADLQDGIGQGGNGGINETEQTTSLVGKDYIAAMHVRNSDHTGVTRSTRTMLFVENGQLYLYNAATERVTVTPEPE